MKKYRCKHVVEALQWTGVEQDTLTTWHNALTGKPPRFLDDGVSVLLGDEWHILKIDEWLLWSDSEFTIVDGELFVDDYESVD